jgi:hypothetical protein
MYLFCLQVSENITNNAVKKSRASHEVKSPTDVYGMSVVVSNVTLLFVTDKQIYSLLIRDRLLSLSPARQTQ